ncbi:MAG: hypothetical protein E7559_01660 [Ruminococcaceae bacterium]|nr:hypothetical protein [Oscillospiraceae bacterium]
MTAIAVPCGQPSGFIDMLAASLMPYGNVYTDTTADNGDCPRGSSFRIHTLGRSEQPDARYAILAAADCAAGHGTISPAFCTRLVFASDSARLRRALAGSPCPAFCCGSNFSDTFALSSNEGDRLWMSVQRSVPTLSGEFFDPAEVALLPEAGCGLHTALVIGAVLVLCGCPMPDEGFRIGRI